MGQTYERGKKKERGRELRSEATGKYPLLLHRRKSKTREQRLAMSEGWLAQRMCCEQALPTFGLLK